VNQEFIQKNANIIHRTFGLSVKALALVGSTSRKEISPKDVDFLLVIDEMDNQKVKNLRNMLDKEIDLLVFDMVGFLERSIKGTPYVISLIKDSQIIYDVGILSAIKRLVVREVLPKDTMGSVVNTLLLSAATSLMEAKWLKARALLGACFNSFTCMLQALTARSKQSISTPKELYEQIDSITIDRYLLEDYRQLYELKKLVDSKDSLEPILDVSVEEWIQKCEDALSKVLIMAKKKEM